MMKQIYLDNSATTPLCEASKKAMCAAMAQYGNPSSLHTLGAEAARLLKQSRTEVGEALGERFLKDGQLLFTSCGTEATALAIQGTARAKSRRVASTVLTTDSEHPSVENNLKLLEKEGFRVVRVPTRGGQLDMKTVEANLGSDLFMVSMMLVNNETGARYPVEQIFAMARAASPEVVCHCDAVQGFLKVPFTARSLGADLITLSAHKIHGPKGVGALFVSERMLRERRLSPFLVGGGQEFGFRSGTENMLGIVGFAAAAKAGAQSLRTSLPHLAALSQKLRAALEGSEIVLNTPPVTAPHIVSLTLPHIKSETMLHHLAARGIYVSAGSACSAHAKGPSSVLLAFGLDSAAAASSLRISFSAENTEQDVDALCEALTDGLGTLVRIKH
ncbi:MAG: cysteine desulfurase [Ruminococcaceae bacterium]|nr:cysteine desulfurase [Oscillospiraceae bacterium]